MKKQARSLDIETRAFINGKYVEAIDRKVIEKTSSADGLPIPNLCSCGVEDINLAVSVAKESFESRTWVNKEPQEKKKVLFSLADLIENNIEELALLDTLETGRAFKNYFFDSIPKAIEALRYFTEGIDKYYDYAIPPRNNSSAVLSREPLGVVGLITPWNDPLVVAMWKLAPALLMGNSVIIKPAEYSSYSILKIAEFSKIAGVPDGVLNVVPGYGNVAGKALALHGDVDGIFFTGSAEVGKKILRYSGSSNMKNVALECGGKSPFIVSKSCKNIKKAAQVLAKNIFYNQGQICSAPSRAIVDVSIKDEFLEHLKYEAQRYIPGDPFDMASEVGCVVNKKQHDKILDFIRQGKNIAETVYCPPAGTGDLIPGGIYVVPTIFEITDPDAVIAQEEIFGPVVVILEVDSLQEAVSIANNSKYGLAASVWTNDINEAHYISRELRAGIVHINCYGDDDNTVPFGGIKESGNGKDKSLYAFDEYSYVKTIWTCYEHTN